MGKKAAAASGGGDDKNFEDENKMLQKRFEVLQYRLSRMGGFCGVGRGYFVEFLWSSRVLWSSYGRVYFSFLYFL